MSRYSRNLEESSFRGRTADFAWLIVYSAASLLVSFLLLFYFLRSSLPSFLRVNEWVGGVGCVADVWSIL